MTLGRQYCACLYREMSAGSARSKTPNMYGNISCGSRESLGLPAGSERDALGSPRTHAKDERTQAVGRSHSTWEVSEQAGSESNRGGGDGGKATDQGEGVSESHAPDSEPDDGHARDAGAPTTKRASRILSRGIVITQGKSRMR
jgi:hypothetical protein